MKDWMDRSILFCLLTLNFLCFDLTSFLLAFKLFKQLNCKIYFHTDIEFENVLKHFFFTLLITVHVFFHYLCYMQFTQFLIPSFKFKSQIQLPVDGVQLHLNSNSCKKIIIQWGLWGEKNMWKAYYLKFKRQIKTWFLGLWYEAKRGVNRQHRDQNSF